jgi:hypothetical protein
MRLLHLAALAACFFEQLHINMKGAGLRLSAAAPFRGGPNPPLAPSCNPTRACSPQALAVFFVDPIVLETGPYTTIKSVDIETLSLSWQLNSWLSDRVEGFSRALQRSYQILSILLDDQETIPKRANMRTWYLCGQPLRNNSDRAS